MLPNSIEKTLFHRLFHSEAGKEVIKVRVEKGLYELLIFTSP